MDEQTSNQGQSQEQGQEEYTVVFLGDSLTAGYGLDEDQSFPSLLEQRFQAQGYDHINFLNAGISGSTSASALNRLQWYLRSDPDMLVLSLGANDGLRGLRVEQMKQNLAETIELAQEEGMDVALTGMMIPPNYGEQYASSFAQVFPDLAREYDLPFLPFLLEGVAAQPELNQADGVHPNAEGTRVVAQTMYEFLKPLLPPP